MPLIPLSFVFSILLCLSIYQFIAQGKVKSHFVFFVLFIVMMVQSVIIGLNWGYGIRDVLVFQSVLATTIPPLIWLSYQSLIRPIQPKEFAHHSIPFIAMILVHLSGVLDLIDIIIMATFLAYGLALLHVAKKGEDILHLVRHDSSERCFYLFRLTGWMLIASVVVEAVIFVDFTFNEGKISGVMVSVSNLSYLLVLWMASFLIQEGKVADETTENLSLPIDLQNEPKKELSNELINESINELAKETSNEPINETSNEESNEQTEENDELADIAEHIKALMQSGLYKDLELNTTKIARKVGVPARKISQAINRTYGKSVSQYVNQFRIEEACQLLTNTEDSITQIALNSGFMTKSNFNREFSRITGTTPTQWRKQNATEKTQ